MLRQTTGCSLSLTLSLQYECNGVLCNTVNTYLMSCSPHQSSWISWLLKRWRTQRNAIGNANCRTLWVIESLNAHCTSFGSMFVWVLFMFTISFFEGGKDWAELLPSRHYIKVRRATATSLGGSQVKKPSAFLTPTISNQARRPAELKHLTKQRKRK